ncbi:MAG: hypothetical protein CMJ16_08800 [Peredibacter sp.]|nr:hypothetical protein [Peredibacter sp.]|tara:strand:+ start:267 stop:566 length:300 start_codon:yes stop_codon:yes gene_type:complete
MTNTESNSIKNYIDMAKTGHCPLFFSEWLDGPLQSSQALTYRSAKRNVGEVFSKLSKHRSIERKKTMVESFSDQERAEFIQSFFKLVERDILQDLKTLH